MTLSSDNISQEMTVKDYSIDQGSEKKVSNQKDHK